MPSFIDFKALKRLFSVTDALRHYGYLDRMVEMPSGQLKGPCLIHKSKPGSTSFKVTPSHLGFRCFGCGAKGNVLDLVASVEGVSVHEAALLIQGWIDVERCATATQPDAERFDAKASDDAEGEEVSSEGKEDCRPLTPYEVHIFSGIPLYSSRLVRETTVEFDDLAETRSPAVLFSFLRPYFDLRDREELVVVLLNTASRVIGLVPVSTGGLSSSILEPRFVFKPAILANAASVVVAHNHPSGNPEPSEHDVSVTKVLVQAGEVLGIPVHDHLIVTESQFTSFAERGLMG
ncbi:MAG: JAB domain-containing protein [Pseudomonadota bacterium]